ncbi:hypothetical protein HMPREF9607_00246, partial [Cutibacterium modestum HL044PA1]
MKASLEGKHTVTPVALPSIADLDHAVNNLTDALITATDAAETSTDSGW